VKVRVDLSVPSHSDIFAVEHLRPGCTLKVACLARRDLVIDDHELRLRPRFRIRLDRRGIRLLLVGVLKALAGLRLLRNCLRFDDARSAGVAGPKVNSIDCRGWQQLMSRPIRWRGCSPPKQADAPAGRNVSGAPPGESAPWAPSTGTCSLRPSAPASRPPWRRRKDVPGYHPVGSVRASGNCARNRASR
jgi:hypothetical protein